MFGESLINGFATLGIVIIEDDGLYGGVDVGNIGLYVLCCLTYMYCCLYVLCCLNLSSIHIKSYKI